MHADTSRTYRRTLSATLRSRVRVTCARPFQVLTGVTALGAFAAAADEKNGYATALVGKWHLGYKHEFSPRAHGFDLFFGYKSAAIDYYTHFTTRPSEGAQFVSGQPDLWEDDALIEQDGYTRSFSKANSAELPLKRKSFRSGSSDLTW